MPIEKKGEIKTRKEYQPVVFGRSILMTLLGVLLVYAIFYLGTVIRNDLKKYNSIGSADKMERTISVGGYGKATGANNIAVTTIGYSNTNKDIAAAQAENKRVMDAVILDLKKMGVEEKDLQSDYSIYPDYDYSSGKGRALLGYRVTNNVTVKIRDLSQVDKVLGLAGKYGANEVSGLTFTLDDPQNLKDQARQKAVQNAQAKARALAQSLGVRLVAVTSYAEYENPDVYPMMKNAVGMGGADESAPTVSPGSNDAVVNVNITYEIAPL